MKETTPLLGAKLLPPAPGPFHLPRPRLHEKLHHLLEGRATAVLAGPGYGKTSLVSRFLQDPGTDSIWLTLDPFDRDPWLLFRYLIRALREHVAEFGERTQALWEDQSMRSRDVESLCDVFLSDAEESLSGRYVLVLDEVEAMHGSEACVRALRRLLAYLPGTLHLVLIGRSLPEVGIKAMTADGKAGLLSGEDLLFTLEETRTLLRETFRLPLRDEAIRKVHARTRGWATALQLLRQTARLQEESPDLPEEVFVKTEAEIFEYFGEEVLASEPPETREFLLASSLPTVVDPEILAKVLPAVSVRQRLGELLKRKLFLSPLESRGEYYAYDPLFRDYLQKKLRAESGPAAEKDLHARYFRAFVQRGEITQALAHARAAGAIREVSLLLREHGKALLRSGMLDAARDAARWLAAEGVHSAVLEDLLGEAARLSGDHAAAVGHFEKALSAAPRGAGRLPTRLRAAALQGLAYSLVKVGEIPKAEATAERALREAGEMDPSLRARILNTLSIIRYRENRLVEAIEGWQQALGLARQSGDEHLILMIAHNLGLPHAVLGDFRRASECFRVLTGPDNLRLGPEEGAAYLNLARIETLRGDYLASASLLGDAREIAQKLRLQSLGADVLEAEGTLLRETGDLEGAREKYSRARTLFTELGQDELLENLSEEEALLAAYRGDFEEAERVASDLVRRRRAGKSPEGTASAHLALGEIQLRGGDPVAALDPLSEACRIFKSLERSYQDCLAHLSLALACHRCGKKDPREAAALEALRLSARFDYRAAVLRVAHQDEGFRKWLGTLSSAPAYLREEPSPEAAREKGALARSQRSDLTIRLLGSIEVFRDEERKIPPRAWKLKRALEIFCFLAVSRDRRATKDRIVDALWGDARLAVVEKNFHPTISFLRGALNHGHNVPKNFVLFERNAYLLNPAYRYDIDIEKFESGLREARGKASRREFPAALEAYDASLSLYRGSFLEEEYEEWMEAPRAHYESLYLAALVEAGSLHMERGSKPSGLSYLKKRTEQDPLSEEASSHLMLALGELGSRQEVDAEFERLGRALSDELESTPLAATVSAFEKARNMKPRPPDEKRKVVPLRRGGKGAATGKSR
jgi:ATP/maltotriose-dependent transcriptional regulator MalT/DNA-binding SARP family transcriptional activator